MNVHSIDFVEHLYADYLRNPQSVEPQWRQYFEQLSDGDGSNGHWHSGPSFQRQSLFHSSPNGRTALPRETSSDAAFQERVDLLVRNYRVRGHRAAKVDPLGQPLPQLHELDPATYGFRESDLDRTVSTKSVGGYASRTLRALIASLKRTYCDCIGVQFMHIDHFEVREWLQDRMEENENRIKLTRDEQRRILTRLTDAVMFEEFVQKKFLGAKSFSLEGAETLIPLLDLAIEKAGDEGEHEIVIGMGHRGRLNVLANILHKGARLIFREFEDADHRLHIGAGDVKYHLGYSNDWVTSTGRKVHLSLCFNPSHLEFVNPVVMGRMRAKQDRFGIPEDRRGLSLLIHGDAAFAGEGVVQETLNMSQLPGYAVGGTLHVIVNNQLGFTTLPSQGRSTTYATDVAKMLHSPVFHVNGENPEAVAQVVRLALDFRRKFRRDVVIDMYCYRLHGHNEGDEPTFTQPVMYRTIKSQMSVRESYLERLLMLGGITVDDAERIEEESRNHLESELQTARSADFQQQPEQPQGIWKDFFGGPESAAADVDTTVKRDRLSKLLDLQTHFPETFHPHPKIERANAARQKMAAGEQPLDWAAGESLAFATLATDGIPIRLSGQDCERGTFSHRHAVLHDVENGSTYTPLKHLDDSQARVEIINSPLSETGVMGFEYGYSLDTPDGLVLWEAQFGDFVNAGQVIVDQFIASAEDKWRRLSGLVLLLPHGYEGMGPEHSSARIERFLTLSAEDNIQVVVPSTPAQFFHVLRRQALRQWRKPLVVFTPKSLLRHHECVSSFDDFEKRGFQRVIPSDAATDSGPINRVLMCSGKIYYELKERQRELKRTDVAIVRVEQLYPFPTEKLRDILASYADHTPTFWVQEEPENMGAWRFLVAQFGRHLFDRLPFSVISRPASASPATGSKASHQHEQNELLTAALGGK